MRLKKQLPELILATRPLDERNASFKDLASSFTGLERVQTRAEMHARFPFESSLMLDLDKSTNPIFGLTKKGIA